MIPHDTALEAQNNQFSNRGSGSSTALSNHSSEFSIKFSSSTFMNGSMAIDESQLWKVTLRIFPTSTSHPTTENPPAGFCKLSVLESRYCLEFSIASGRLKISR